VNLLIKLKAILPKSEIRKVYILLAGVILSGIFETFGVGIIMPFISVVNDPSVLEKYPLVMDTLNRVGIESKNEVIVSLSIVLLGIMCTKNLYLFIFMRYKLRFLNSNTARCAINLLDRYLHADYLYHVQTNTSELIRNLKSEVTRVFTSVLGPLVDLTSEILLIVFMLALLLAVEPIATISGVLVLGVISGLFYKSIDKKNKYYGEMSIKHESETYKWINQSLGGIKELKLLGREDYFKEQCETHYREVARINVYSYLISQAPRLFLETLMVGAIVMIIIVLVLQGSSGSNILPTLALFGAAAIRLMPATNRVLGSAIALRFSIPAVNVIYDSMQEIETRYNSQRDITGKEELTFHEGIHLENVSFRYPAAEASALENVTLHIPKNSSMGIIGMSGAGKTTLLNILLGLLKPTKGRISSDNIDITTNLRGWQKMIGFVPQDIYLMDDTIKRNVAYGVHDSDIDESAVWKALELAQVDSFVKDLPDGLDTFVGERGVRISGGQRQRIGIARALYNNPDILIFDEATSSVDMVTEREITKSIESLARKKTVIIVTHRLSTVEKCDQVYTLDGGSIKTPASEAAPL